MANKKRNIKILDDHKKVGKKLVPPLAQLKGIDMTKSYYDTVVPEGLWIAMMNKAYGKSVGLKFFEKFMDTILKIVDSKETPYLISWFYKLDKETAAKIKKDLVSVGIYKPILDSIKALLNVYPECPLVAIFETDTHTVSDVNEVKAILTELTDKKSVESTFMLASVLYYLMRSGRINVPSSSVMAKLPLLEDYPKSDMSRMIASAVRASSNLMFDEPMIKDKNDKWINYFWNRGLILESCEI